MTCALYDYTASRISTAKLTECLGEVSLTKKEIAMQSDEGERKRSYANAALCCLAMTSSSSCDGVWRDGGMEVPLFLGIAPPWPWPRDLETFRPDNKRAL